MYAQSRSAADYEGMRADPAPLTILLAVLAGILEANPSGILADWNPPREVLNSRA